MTTPLSSKDLTTPASSLVSDQALPKVRKGVKRSQESSEAPLPLIDQEKDQLKAQLSVMVNDYNDTIRRTNLYDDGVKAQKENYAAYKKLTDFADKHSLPNRLLPCNPRALSGDCSIS